MPYTGRIEYSIDGGPTRAIEFDGIDKQEAEANAERMADLIANSSDDETIELTIIKDWEN